MDVAIINPVVLNRQLQGWREGSDAAAWRNLAEALKLLVLDGRLGLNARLPGERRLAEVLGISRITVSAALDRLRSEGFVISRIGSGSFTALPPGPATRPDPLHQLEPSGLIDMATAVMPAGAEVHAAYAKALASLPAHLPGHGYGPVGVEPLRRAIAGAYDAMGLATPPDAVVVTAGAQNAFALLLRALCRPGDAVVIDHPSFHHAIDAITRAGLKPVPVPLAPEGWDIDALTTTILRVRPRLIYLIGAHHNPTGMVMTAAEEAAIARAAARAGSIVVFDDTLRELWFDSPPPRPEALGEHVVRLGSTSKAWWGGLRIGWLRAGSEVVEAVIRNRASLDLGVPIIEQLAAAILLAGDPAPLAERRARIAAQEGCLRDLLSRSLPDWDVRRPPGGLSLWVALPRPVSETLAVAAARHGVRIAPGTRFGVGGEFRRFIRLPFTLPEPELERAVPGLAAAWRETTREGKPAGRPRPTDLLAEASVL